MLARTNSVRRWILHGATSDVRNVEQLNAFSSFTSWMSAWSDNGRMQIAILSQPTIIGRCRFVPWSKAEYQLLQTPDNLRYAGPDQPSRISYFLSDSLSDSSGPLTGIHQVQAPRMMQATFCKAVMDMRIRPPVRTWQKWKDVVSSLS